MSVGRPAAVLWLLVLLVATTLPVLGYDARTATTFEVDGTADDVDVNPGDGVCATEGGVCTLRAAVQESNALPGADTIEIPRGDYVFGLQGLEDAAAAGDLDVTDSVTILGEGPTSTVIDANYLDRVFHIQDPAGSVTIDGVGLVHGNPLDNNSFAAGVMSVGDASLVFSNSMISEMGGTSNAYGIGISGDLIFRDSVISGSAAGISGGDLLVERSTITGNVRFGISAGDIEVSQSTISDNGGGIQLSGGSIVNSTISGNVETDGAPGGGIRVLGSGGHLLLANVTITGNSTHLGISPGGGIWVEDSQSLVEIQNSILSGNAGGDAPDCSGQLDSFNYNLIADLSGCDVTEADNLVGVDPMLGPLQDNGGPTHTHELEVDSPARDAASPVAPGSGGNTCEETDQRGIVRPQGTGCDVGAFERKVDTFSDDDGNTFEADIEWSAGRGITKGCNPPVNGRYCPDDFVTRGQMAAFLVRALGYDNDGGGNLFTDDDGNTFENDIDRLGTAGVTKGCNPPVNDRYCPDDFVTRGQMAAFLVRALGYDNDGGGNLFTDDDGNTFENDIDRLGTAGVTKGCNPPVNDPYCPDDFVTRGQMAAFLHRALES